MITIDFDEESISRILRKENEDASVQVMFSRGSDSSGSMLIYGSDAKIREFAECIIAALPTHGAQPAVELIAAESEPIERAIAELIPASVYNDEDAL